MSVFLSILALIIFVILHVIDSFVVLFKGIRKRKWYKLIKVRYYRKAYNIDVFGNYQFKDTWNLLLSKNGYEFGKFGETISSVLGKKQIEKSLTKTGWALLFIINIIDFPNLKNGGHCKVSIQNEEQIKKFIKNKA